MARIEWEMQLLHCSIRILDLDANDVLCTVDIDAIVHNAHSEGLTEGLNGQMQVKMDGCFSLAVRL